jgi:SNF2 family DNA or RNA helicase
VFDCGLFFFSFLKCFTFITWRPDVLVMGLMENSPGQGCILADDMGLGKTIQVRRELGADFIDTTHSLFWVFLLQSIVLIWTLLKQGQKGPCPQNDPIAKRVIVITPTR